STHSPTSLWTFGVNTVSYRKKHSRNWKKTPGLKEMEDPKQAFWLLQVDTGEAAFAWKMH
ncbi:hypothetical protein, partial [Desulfococcus multivorans]|uniref:hypothetical protein n=1 Tax=Desulfococcus multivorans TaxID=897 RepID=UPI001F48A06D